MEPHDLTPFRKINSVFPILKMPQAHDSHSFPPKIGELELEISCSYDPSVKLKYSRVDAKTENPYTSPNFENNKLERKRQEIREKKAIVQSQGSGQYHTDVRPQAGANETSVKRNLDPIESAIEKAIALKAKMLAAETNKDLDLRGSIVKDLYDGASMKLLLDPHSTEARPMNREVELERLKLALQQPEIESVIGFSEISKKAKEKYALEMTDIQKLKIAVYNFVPEHPVLAERLREKNLFLQIKLPKFHEKLIQDTLEFALDEHCGSPQSLPYFTINKEIKNAYLLNEIGIERLSKSSVNFNLLIKMPKIDQSMAKPAVKKPAAITSQPTEQISTGFTVKSVARGIVNLGDLLNYEHFRYEGKIMVDSLIGLDKKKNELMAEQQSKNKPTVQKNVKKQPQEDVLPKEVGYFSVLMEFINDNIKIVPLPEPPKPSEEYLRIEAENRRLTALKQSKVEMEKRLKGEPLLPVCLFVHVMRASKVPKREDSKVSRNLYIQHKLYGTPDDISSPIFWNQSNPEIDHRVVIPLTKMAIELMKDVPFTVSVWDKKDDPKKDELLGIVHVSLKAVYSLLWPMDEQDLRAMLAKQDLNMLELTNKYYAIERLSSSHESGFLKIYASLGNIHQVSQYNSLHPGNNSRMLGVDPTTFDFQTLESLQRKRDPKKKKKLRLNEIQKAMLDRDPAARHLTKTLVDQLNKDEIPMDQFLHELQSLMSRHPDVRIVDALKTIEKEAEICNPHESIDTSRKNYVRLGDRQVVYDSHAKKYFQIWGEGIKTPLDKCHYRRDDGSLDLLLVDPEAVKIKRDDTGVRLMTSKQVGKLKKMGKQFNVLSKEEEQSIRQIKAARRNQLKEEAKAEEEEMDRQIREAEQKIEDSKAIIEAYRAADKLLTESVKETTKPNLEQDAFDRKEDSLPLAQTSQRSGFSGWDKAKAKLGIIKKNTQREDESYGSPSARSIAVTGRGGKDKFFVNLLNTNEQDNDTSRHEKEISQGISKFQKPPDSPRSHRSIFKESKRKDSQLSGSAKDSSSRRFDVIQVGMALHGAVIPAIESSEDTSEENKTIKNINLVDKSGEQEDYDPKAKVNQFETEVQDDLEIPDPILNLTILLEYIRREVFKDETLRKNLKHLLLGQFQSQMVSGTGFDDLEYLMEQYKVSINASELKNVFDFLDADGTGEISLHDLHESLISYIQLIKRFLRQYEGTFKYLLDKITNQENGMQLFEEFLSQKSENNHIECKQLFTFIRNEFFVQDTELIEYQIREFGEFLYFDQVYIFNILNMLYLLDASYSQNCNPQLVKGIFHYESFLPLILQKVRKMVSKYYEDESPMINIKETLSELNLIEESRMRKSNRLIKRQSSSEYDEKSDCIINPVRVNFNGFRDILSSVGLKNMSVYEMMIIFYFICDLKCKNRHVLEPDHQTSIQEIYVFFQLIVGENPEQIQGMINRKLVGSLASFVNKELMFQDSTLSPTQSRSSSFVSMKRSKLMKRRKFNADLVLTNRTLYRITLNVLGIEDLKLPTSNDYCDLTISFFFPGEAEKFESQLFTYIPKETDYDLLLNTEHIFRCPSDVDISAVFSEFASVRFSLTKMIQNRVEEVAYCLIPVNDILSKQPRSRKYFLYQSTNTAGISAGHIGSVRVALAYFSDNEKLTQKDYFFSKHFIVNNQRIEKDVTFERDVPRKGYLTIQITSLSQVQGFYTLLDEMKRLCRFQTSQSRYTLSFILKIKEVQKAIVLKKDNELEQILEEDSEGEEEFALSLNESDKKASKNQEENIHADIRLFPDFAFEIKTASIGSLDSLFNFVDSFCSKQNHLIYNLQKFNLELNSETLALLQSSEMDVGLYLGCSGLEGYKESKVCNQLLPCNQFITLQNLQGKRQVHTMTSESSKSVNASIDLTLNYTKVFLNDGHVRMLNRFKELEAMVELLRPLLLLVDLSQIISMDDSCKDEGQVYFMKAYLGDTLVQSSSAIEWQDTDRLVRWAKMNTIDSNTLIEFKMEALIEELSLERVYENFRQSPEDTNIREFMLNYVPQLRILLTKHDVNHSQKTIAYLSLDMKQLVKNALESNLLPSSIIFKGYLPFEEECQEIEEIQDEIKDGDVARPPKKTKTSLLSSSLIGSIDSLRESVGSIDSEFNTHKTKLRKPKFKKTRLGLRVIFVSSKGMYNKESLNGFKLLQQQPWVKSAEDYIQKLQYYKHTIDECLSVHERGFLATKHILKNIIATELDLGQVMTNCILDIVGEERTANNKVKLHNLICYPLHNNISIRQQNITLKTVEGLEKEFRHFDTEGSGFVQFGEAIKLILNQPTSDKLTMKQLQAFKYSDLMRDFRESMTKPAIRSLERRGFDYIIFINELLESARRNDRIEKQSSIKLFPPGLQLLLMDGLNRGQGEAEVNMADTVKEKVKGKTNVLGSLGYVFRFEVVRGEKLEGVCSNPFPSTLVKVTRNYDFWPEGDSSSELITTSDIILRDPEPEWGLTITTKITNLDLFRKSNTDSFFEIELIERTLTRERTSEGMFSRSTVSKKSFYPAAIMENDTLAAFAKDDSRDSLTCEANLQLDDTDASLTVAVRLAKISTHMDGTLPRPAEASTDKDIEAIKKTLSDMNMMSDMFMAKDTALADDDMVKALREVLGENVAYDEPRKSFEVENDTIRKTVSEIDEITKGMKKYEINKESEPSLAFLRVPAKDKDIRIDSSFRDSHDQEYSARQRSACSLKLYLANMSIKDRHNDTARFGEASAQDVFTLNPPTPNMLSKRGSIFLKMEERNMSPVAGLFRLMHPEPKVEEFSIDEYSVTNKAPEASEMKDHTLKDIKPVEESEISKRSSSDSKESFLEPEDSHP